MKQTLSAQARKKEIKRHEDRIQRISERQSHYEPDSPQWKDYENRKNKVHESLSALRAG